MPSGRFSNWLLAMVTFVPLMAKPIGRIPGAVPWKRLFLTMLPLAFERDMCSWLSRRVLPSMISGSGTPYSG